MGFDIATIQVRAGNGGHGLISFRREKFVPRGGPDGGDGGHGGSVILLANRGESTLNRFRYMQLFRAGDGGHGGKSKKHGRNGKDTVIMVPEGTVARWEWADDPIGEVLAEGDRLTVARGGRGGWGNIHFANSVRQAPRVATAGEPGEQGALLLELKLVADVGLIGLPNAGKSSLLAAMTRAHPKVAAYPFTTLTPNLGVADTGKRTFVLADIPGLIEGASRGIGLGHEFLRHIERNRLLLHVVDISTEDPVADWQTIQDELRAYGHGVDEKPQVTVLNKIDLVDDARKAEIASTLRMRLGQGVLVLASAEEGEGIPQLELALDEAVRALPPPVVVEEVPVLRPQPRTPVVSRDEDGRLVVESDRAARFARSFNLREPDAQAVFWEEMQRQGVIRQLERLEAIPGETVWFGDVPVSWVG